MVSSRTDNVKYFRICFGVLFVTLAIVSVTRLAVVLSRGTDGSALRKVQAIKQVERVVPLKKEKTIDVAKQAPKIIVRKPLTLQAHPKLEFPKLVPREPLVFVNAIQDVAEIQG
jgi:hypothetical protein